MSFILIENYLRYRELSQSTSSTSAPCEDGCLRDGPVTDRETDRQTDGQEERRQWYASGGRSMAVLPVTQTESLALEMVESRQTDERSDGRTNGWKSNRIGRTDGRTTDRSDGDLWQLGHGWSVRRSVDFTN